MLRLVPTRLNPSDSLERFASQIDTKLDGSIARLRTADERDFSHCLQQSTDWPKDLTVVPSQFSMEFARGIEDPTRHQVLDTFVAGIGQYDDWYVRIHEAFDYFSRALLPFRPVLLAL